MPQSTLKIKPSVDAAQEFIEIASDFSNPLDLVREAIRLRIASIAAVSTSLA